MNWSTEQKYKPSQREHPADMSEHVSTNTFTKKKKKDMRASDFRFVLCNYYIYLYTQRHLGPGKSSASSWYIVVRPDQRSMTTKHLWIDQSGC